MDNEILAVILALILLAVAVVVLFLFFSGYIKFGNALTDAAFKSITDKICGILPIGFKQLCSSLGGS